jgi:hypothetical protein
MLSYSEQQRESPQDAPAMTAAEWAAYALELDRDNQDADAEDGGMWAEYQQRAAEARAYIAGMATSAGAELP